MTLFRGRAQARREVDEIVGDLLSLCDRVKVERDALRADVRAREYEHAKAVAQAIAERDPNAPLH